MQVIERTVVNGAELVLMASGDQYEMISPITGKHSVNGSKERGMAHWNRFVAMNKDVPKPFAVYQNESGKKIWYYEVPEEPTALYFHEGGKPVLSHMALKDPKECKILSRFPIDLLDSYHVQEGFVRIEKLWS
jgi:hypothetical protein